MFAAGWSDASGGTVSWADPIVIVAGNKFDGLGSSDRHLALRLAEHAPVIFVDPPSSGCSRPGHTTDVPFPGILRITPTLPRGMYRPGFNQLLPHLVARTVRSTLAALHTEASSVIVACPLPILSLIPARRRVLYATDDWLAGADLMGLPRRRILRVQAQQLASADIVITVSDVLGRRYSALGHSRVVVVPNGCDIERLAGVEDVARADDVQLQGPIAGVVGNLSERISLSHLEAVADRQLSLLLIGPRRQNYGGERFDELVRRPNVQWVGERPYAEMSSYLQLIDVGLTPYGSSRFNRASSPLKTIEYLAAGRGSVSTDLPGVRAFDTEQVTIANSPEGFADAVQRSLRIARTPQLVSDRHAAVAPHNWTLRALDVLNVLEETAPGARRLTRV
jgi:teichuronic acid biosynthesis glycosyltransferase TuaH